MLTNLNKTRSRWPLTSHPPSRAQWSRESELSSEVACASQTKELSWGETLFPEANNPVLISIASLALDNDYDENFQKPTESNFTEIVRLIRSVYSTINKEYPLPFVSADGSGGIRLRWVLAEKEIRLKYNDGSSKKSYIYHQQSDSYDIEYEVNSEILKKWLDWLISA